MLRVTEADGVNSSRRSVPFRFPGVGKEGRRRMRAWKTCRHGGGGPGVVIVAVVVVGQIGVACPIGILSKVPQVISGSLLRIISKEPEQRPCPKKLASILLLKISITCMLLL